jgi:F0F1-type ATP synthase assembly protein I
MTEEVKKSKLPKLVDNPARKLMNSSAVGYDLAANVVMGIGIGWVIMHFWPSTKPWSFLICMALGIISGFWQLYKTVLRPTKKKAEE